MIKNANSVKSMSVSLGRHLHTFKAINYSIKSSSYSAILALSFGLPSQVYAEDKIQTTYGPIKAGETLWDVAKATRPNKEISIEQQIFALYSTNPDAFKTGNMNVLPRGKVLKIPSLEAVTKISKENAKAQLNKHAHALDVLRVDARQLKASKRKSREYKKRVVVLQRQLGRYKHKSKNWNRTYLKLVAAKRKYSNSKKRVAKLNNLLLQKATLKYTKPTKKEAESQALVAVKELESNTLVAVKEAETKTLTAIKDVESKTLEAVKVVETNTIEAVKKVESNTLEAVKQVETKTLVAVEGVETKTLGSVKDVESKSLIAVNETNEKLTQIQSSLVNITESNSSLTEKVNALTTLNQRVVVLEEELGKNDEILLQLKASVETLEVAIQKTTEQLKQQNDKHQQQIKELSEIKKQPQQIVSKEVPTSNNSESTTELAQTNETEDSKVAQATDVKVESNDTEKTTEESAVTENLVSQETTQSDDASPATMKVSFNPEITDTISENAEEKPLALGSATQLTESIAKPKNTRNQLSEFKTDGANAISSEKGTGGGFIDMLTDNWIFLVTIINGLILMFVFYWTIKNNSYPEDD